MNIETILSFFLGIGLSAACGLRVFVPPLIVSIAAVTGYFTPATSFEWLGTYPVLFTFGIATVIEIGGYYIPWVDNMLDVIATPAAMVAGTFLTAASVVGMEPWLQWALALIAGGGVAGIIQIFTGVTRAASTATTGGLGNALLATLEAIGSIFFSILAILQPLIMGVILIILLWIAVRRVFRPATP